MVWSAIGVAGLLAIAALGGALAQRCFEASCRDRGWPGQGIVTPAGVVHVWCEGEGAPTILLEASGLGGSMQYARVLPELARRARTCAWDRPGMGWSSRAPRDATATDQGERILAALESLDIRGPLVLVGASMGGMVTLAIAHRHPDRVAGIVLLDALGPDGVAAHAEPLAKLGRAARQAEWAARIGLLRFIDPFHLSAEDACLTYRSAVFGAAADMVATLPESARQVRESPPLPGTIPVIALRHGRAGDLFGTVIPVEEQRKVEPEWIRLQERLVAGSASGHVEMVEGSGHLIANERPDAVVHAVDEILGRANR
jgi:pimeloyl-ACP methyl ester carboxylesterase